MSYTIIIIAITTLISIGAFNSDEIYGRLILWPIGMRSPVQYYRLLSSGFIHADWPHLIFNMFTLYFFGENIEIIFAQFGLRYLFIVLYLAGIIIASLPSFIKNINNSYYRSLGASGGVAAVLFANVYFMPWNKIYMMFIPIGIPSILFAVLYLVYSAYMNKRGADNINHNAHIWGSVFGFVFAFIFDMTHGLVFLGQFLHPSF